MWYYVYILESKNFGHWYVGVTSDLQKRVIEHNSGKSIHTNKYKPWSLSSCTAFNNKKKAMDFEKYLKSHSGRAFQKKHF